jgi:hypothetical protein
MVFGICEGTLPAPCSAGAIKGRRLRYRYCTVRTLRALADIDCVALTRRQWTTGGRQ